MANLPIDDTLTKINETYRRCLLMWLKRHPSRWRQLLALESRINETALSKQDGITLKNALEDYKEFFEEMCALYVKGDPLPLGAGR
jgi:hypothetical protein